MKQQIIWNFDSKSFPPPDIKGNFIILIKKVYNPSDSPWRIYSEPYIDTKRLLSYPYFIEQTVLSALFTEEKSESYTIQ